MDINSMLKRVENAYANLNHVHAAGEELDHLAMARQELRNLFADLKREIKNETKGDNET